MSDAQHAPERLDIEVDQLAGLGPLVAVDHRRRFEMGHSIEAGADEYGGHSGAWHLELHGGCPRGAAVMASGDDRGNSRGGGPAWLATGPRRSILDREEREMWRLFRVLR